MKRIYTQENRKFILKTLLPYKEDKINNMKKIANIIANIIAYLLGASIIALIITFILTVEW